MNPIPMQPNMPQATNTFGRPVKSKQWYECTNCKHKAPFEREWVGLTDEDMAELDEDGVLFARYIEAKLKEKNT